MKRILLISIGLLCLSAALWAEDMMSVQVETAQVRGRPSYVGPVVAEVAYGDRIEVLNERGGWSQIRTPGGETGWIQGSALSRKEIVLSTGGSVSSGASSDEVALAGKGFNAEIEQEYKDQTQLDFSWVDRMEEWVIPNEELVAFLEEGELEGAVQ